MQLTRTVNDPQNEELWLSSAFWYPHQEFSDQTWWGYGWGSAFGHLTVALYEVVNLAPFVTSFSMRLMASWQLYSLLVLWVVMQRNYIGPNLMNQVNVPPAQLTLLASALLPLHAGQIEAFTLCTIQSHSSRIMPGHAPLITTNQECTDLLWAIFNLL